MSFWNRRQQMGWAALIMGSSILLSRFMGLIRDKTISFLFGATRESDIYFAAFVIPDYINYLLAGAYFSVTLIPLLTAYFDQSEEEGWRFFSAIFTWIGLSITVVTGICMVFSHQLAYIAAPGLGAQASARLAFFLRIILPAQVFFLLGSCLTALLYFRKQFFVPALTSILYNLMIVVCGVIMRSRGMEGFCWGVLSGAFLGFVLVPYWAARNGGGIKLGICFSHPGLRKFMLLALPLMLGQSIVVLDEQFVRIFGSLAGVGAISWLNYARRIMQVPVGVVAQAAGVATFPFLADLAAKKDYGRFHGAIHDALQAVLTLLIPLSIWMMVVAGPTIQLIFQQGHFDPSDTRQTALLLQIFLVSVFCWGVQQILGRAFYARQDTLTPAVLGTLTTLAALPLFFLLSRYLKVIGVAIASASSIGLYTAVLAAWWRHKFGKETFTGILGDLLKVCALSLVSSAPAYLIVRSISLKHHPYLEALSAIGASGLCFGLVFLLLAYCFIPTLIRPFVERLGPVGKWVRVRGNG